MIVKKGKKWLVKDSSGKKILGTHTSEDSAKKQLAAIEISKKQKEKELKELFAPKQNFNDQFYALRCTELNERKKNLELEFNQLKNKNLLNLLSEEPYVAGHSQAQAHQQSAQAQQQGQSQQRIPTRQRRRMQDSDNHAYSEDNSANASSQEGDPWPMAQSHMGMALTPQSAGAQQDLLTKYFDNPETAEVEVADSPTWQNVQSAISHSVGSEVNRKLRDFGLLG